MEAKAARWIVAVGSAGPDPGRSPSRKAMRSKRFPSTSRGQGRMASKSAEWTSSTAIAPRALSFLVFSVKSDATARAVADPIAGAPQSTTGILPFTSAASSASVCAKPT